MMNNISECKNAFLNWIDYRHDPIEKLGKLYFDIEEVAKEFHVDYSTLIGAIHEASKIRKDLVIRRTINDTIFCIINTKSDQVAKNDFVFKRSSKCIIMIKID